MTNEHILFMVDLCESYFHIPFLNFQSMVFHFAVYSNINGSIIQYKSKVYNIRSSLFPYCYRFCINSIVCYSLYFLFVIIIVTKYSLTENFI